ncbi:hypothetical protein MRQ36_32205 [Micromonospora sp. R77]|uniref:hypothetical protein n=1 Tax=Micromonospora sp. R77 TaxID=2925836 RepID=UPI001F613175|nr:hypothetical protein [Micromonospora sp. R77]MCI4066977.1 hypothetical protein [Micromonospora sp. R77]
MGHRVVDPVGGERADPAQVLGQDEVRVEARERAGVQRVKVRAGGELPLDVRVDLAGAHPPGVPPADDDGRAGPVGGRHLALEGDADQLVAEAEGVDDLRGGGQQGHQTHPAILPARDPSTTTGPAHRFREPPAADGR